MVLPFAAVGLEILAAGAITSLAPYIAPYLASLTEQAVSGLSTAAQTATAAFADLFKGTEPQLSELHPAFKDVDFSKMKNNALSVLPAGMSPRDALQYGVLAFGTAAFMMFIIEEAIQATSMAVWQGISHGLYDESKKIIGWGFILVNSLKTACIGGSSVNPLASSVFLLYAKAAEEQFKMFQKIAEKGEGGRYQPKSGGIFDLR